jgi:hypothetical protein
MLTDEDLIKIDKIVERHSTSDEVGCLTVLFVLFLIGFFRGCAY